MLNDENAFRRKSSLVYTGQSPLGPQNADLPQKTSCFVHQFLKKQQKSRKASPSAFVCPDGNGENQKLDKGNVDENEVHSRLLTKKQLTDMALGVRELSKQLGSLRLKLNVKTVFLLVKAHDESLLEFSRELVDWLLSTERDAEYIVCASRKICTMFNH